MPRRGVSEGKQVIKFATTSNRGRVCLSFQNDKAILNLQNVQFKFRQVPRHDCLLLGHLRSVLHSKNNNNHFRLYFSIDIALKIISFSYSVV